jgi:hypothetical protein
MRANEPYLEVNDVFEQAEKQFMESVQISREMGNYYRLADNLADLTLLYAYQFENLQRGRPDPIALRNQTIKMQGVAQNALTISRRYGLSLAESRAMEALGDLYYREGKYLRAFAQYYLPALLPMARYYETSLWRYQQVFDRVHRRLLNPEINDEEVRFIAGYMARRWREEGKDAIAPGFIKIYESIAQDWSVGDIA